MTVRLYCPVALMQINGLLYGQVIYIVPVLCILIHGETLAITWAISFFVIVQHIHRHCKLRGTEG